MINVSECYIRLDVRWRAVEVWRWDRQGISGSTDGAFRAEYLEQRIIRKLCLHKYCAYAVVCADDYKYVKTNISYSCMHIHTNNLRVTSKSAFLRLTEWLHIVSSTLLDSEMCVDGCIPSSAGQILPLRVEVLRWVSVC